MACDAGQLLNEGKEFHHLPPHQMEVCFTQLLCNLVEFQTVGGTMAACDPQTLLADGKAFYNLTGHQNRAVQTQLLCDLAGAFAGSGGFIPRVGADVEAETIDYAASVVLDFDGPAKKDITLNGNIQLATTGRGNGKFFSLRLFNPGVPRTVNIAAGIRPITGAFPLVLGTNKVAWVVFYSNGPDEIHTDVGIKNQP